MTLRKGEDTGNGKRMHCIVLAGVEAMDLS
jgi:hypothetical protein